MSINGNLKKSEVLGMSHGKAANQLRRLLLFGFVQRLGLDKCFRCGLTIKGVTQLSVEHKQPWLTDPDLFWQLDNIAYSHQTCNSRAADRSWHKAQRKVGPEGTEWCSGCKGFQLVEDFRSIKAGSTRPATRTVRWYCKRHPRGKF